MFYEPLVLIVIWTGRKFLFLCQDDTACDLKTIKGAYGEKLESEFLPIIPVNISLNNALDGTGAASIDFSAVDFPFQKLQVRYSYKSKNQLPRTKSTLSKRPYDSFTEDYYKVLHKRHILRFIEEYKNLACFNEKHKNVNELLLETEPFYLFSPPQIIWIFVRDRQTAKWYRLFVGTIDSYTTAEDSTGHRISIAASNLLQLLGRIPVITQGTIYIGLDLLKDTFYDSEKTANFFKYYMAFCYSPVVWLGRSQSLISGFEAMAGLSLQEIFLSFARVCNRAFGFVGDKQTFIKEVTEYFNDVFVGTMLQQTKQEIDIKEIEQVYDYLKEHSFLRFKLVDDTKFHIYNKSLIEIESERISSEHLFLENDSSLSIGKFCINDNIEEILRYEAEQTDFDFKFFQKILMPQIEQFSVPKYVAMSNLIRKLVNNYKFFFHTDGCGNWILEFPKYNAYPKLSGVRKFTPPKTEKYKSYEQPYEDCDERYVLHKFLDLVSYSENVSRERYVNLVQMPLQIIYQGVELPNLQGLMTARAVDVDSIIEIGLSEQALDTVYVSFELAFIGGVLPDNPLMRRLKEFFTTLVECMRRLFNLSVFTANATLKLRPFFDLGRNVIIVHKERIGLITRIAHTINPGGASTTTLTIEGLRPLGDYVPNPWKFYLENTDIAKLIKIHTRLNLDETPTEIRNNVQIENIDDQTLKKYFSFQCMMPKLYIPGKGVWISVHRKLYEDLIITYDVMDDFLSTIIENYLSNSLRYIITSAFRTNRQKSRHYYGRALDIGGVYYRYTNKLSNKDSVGEIRFNSKKGGLNKSLADKLCTLLENLGYKRVNLDRGEKEAPVSKAYIWDCVGHYTHVHISISAKEAERYDSSRR